ncbi:hypothetical protein [Cupriavidus sp. D384]|uniref:hypothetical protein n=1 Tax=Cupriavidus sp. D384 TaxID=1538095 RepID=UPI00082AF182|nr:hypothetical protein [Cupriavidus sp. D384]
MMIRDPLAPSAPLFRVLDSHIECERIANFLGIQVSDLTAFAAGHGSVTLPTLLAVLDAASLEVVESSELAAIKRFAANYLRTQLESRQ